MLSLRRDEALDAGLSRIARETAAQVTVFVEDTAKRTHEARKRLKELRAVLRLGRFGLDGDFGKLNAAIRDAGRDLAGAREAVALVAIARTLRTSTTDPLERRALTRTARLLSAAQPAPAFIAPELPELTFTANGARWLERGLRRTYRAGRRAFREALRARTAAALHDWRKRVKDLWYDAQVFAPAWPAALEPRAELLHRLSRLLGDHHDLCELRARVSGEPRTFGLITAGRVAAAAERRIAEIESAAFADGAFAYADSPRGWSTAVIGFWRAWTATL